MMEESEMDLIDSLICAIKRGDIESVCQRFDSNPNRILRNAKAEQIPPIIWAVKRSQKDIVKLLLDRGMNVNQKGSYFIGGFVTVLTPLLEALRGRDMEMVELLLSQGADPYLYVSKARTHSERDGCLGWYYPITEAIKTDRVQLVRILLEHYNPRTQICIHNYQGTSYLEDGHTCLCFALSLPRWRKKNNNWYEIIQCIILYGGRLCYKDRCSHFDQLVNSVFTKSTEENGEEKIYCNFTCFRILKIILEAHTKKYGFDAVKTLEESTHLQSNTEEGSFGSAFACMKSENCFRYLVSYVSNPTSLGHMCRVAIRQSLRGPVPAGCHKLPLPPKLQACIGTIDEDLTLWS